MIAKLRLLGRALVIATALGAINAQAAFAAANSHFGQNLGDEVKGLAVALFLAIAGLAAIPLLGRKDVNGGLVLVMLVVLLGGFVFAPQEVKHVITDIWGSLVS